jgi:hypothetical protein
MATDKKGVMVYLPADVEQKLERYCADRGITRKSKDGELVASMGTGIVHYLQSQLLDRAASSPSTAGITKDDALELMRELVMPLMEQFTGLRSELDELKSRSSPDLDALEKLRTNLNRKIDALETKFHSHQHKSTVTPNPDLFRSP